MSGMTRNLLGPYPRGVPTPRTVHVHPYPTRYHGTINTRPMFSLPFQWQPHAVFKPDDFNREQPMQGLGTLQYNTGRGIFLPGGYGGGIFDENISGTGSTGLGYSVSNLPWHKYDANTLALQKDLNKALRDLGEPTISEDGKLGDKTCTAARKVNASPGYGYVSVPPECSKSHAPPAAPVVAPALPDTALEPDTFLPAGGGRRMSQNAKNALIFAGAAALTLGSAYWLMKKK